MELIYDRAPADVAARNSRGCYNASDLNRVETACRELAGLTVSIPAGLMAKAEELGVAWDRVFDVGWNPVTLTVKTDWAMEDLPSASQMARYLGNVNTLIRLIEADYPALPDRMRELDWQGANNIEQALAALYDGLTARRAQIITQIRNTAAAVDLGWALGTAHTGLYGGI